MIFFQHIGAPLRAAANAQSACHCKCSNVFDSASVLQLFFQDHAANVAVCFLLFRHAAVINVQRLRNKVARGFAKRGGVDNQYPVHAVHARQFLEVFGARDVESVRVCTSKLFHWCTKPNLRALAAHGAVEQDGVKLLRRNWP